MTAKPPEKPSDMAAKLKVALEMKTRARQAQGGPPGEAWSERDAAARSSSKSKPKIRK